MTHVSRSNSLWLLAVLILGPGAGTSVAQGPADTPAVTVRGQTYTPRTILARNMGTEEDQTTAFTPHRIVGNIYYVGTRTLSSFLIVTPQGHILINSTFERNVRTIEKSVTQLGFRFPDVRILLGNHAHGDHQEGDALVKELTGAQVTVMAEDVPALKAIKPGGKEHPVDRTLRDGEPVTLGGTTLVAHLTPGHTRGCTTFTTTAQEGGRSYNVVFGCSLRAPAMVTPAVEAEFTRSFKLVRSLPCDVQLGDHPAQYNMHAKYAKVTPGGPNPFIDPASCTFEADIQEAMYRATLEGQQTGGAAAQPAATETLSQTFRGSRGRDVEYNKIAPFKVFDNVYHVGPGTVSAWLIPTTDGLILVDTVQEPYVDYVLNNIRNVGYDPKDIKYILLTQGHLDHFGGAARIQELSGARVAAAEGDWVLMDEYARRPLPASPPFHRTVARDIVLKDGDTITLGSTSLKTYLLPGHTPGGASFELTVFDKGRPHKAFLFGGPEPRGGVEGAQQFIASVNRLAQVPDVEVGLLVHSWLAMSTYPNSGTFERAARLQLRRGDGPNPFVDPGSWRAWMDHLKGVSAKFLADEKAKPPAAQGGPGQGAPGQGNAPQRFPTRQQYEASAEAQRRVAAARAIAGTDLRAEFENMCSAAGPQRVTLAREAAGLPQEKDHTVEPTRIFDNMWYVGLASQGAFVITTSDGLILIDTLNTTEEARDVIVPSMKKAGLDPAQIKYIVITHGHPGQTDHTGGASYLQRTYKPRILMSKEDWDATLPAQRPERPLATRDMDITHGQTLTLGDTTLSFTTLFGHSAGSLGIFIPVKWRGQPHVAWLHGGGLHHPTRDSLNRLETVIKDYALKMNADALLNTHPGIYQDTIAAMAAIRKNPNGPNPLLYGRERASRYWSMMVECARGRVAALEQARGGS